MMIKHHRLLCLHYVPKKSCFMKRATWTPNTFLQQNCKSLDNTWRKITTHDKTHPIFKIFELLASFNQSNTQRTTQNYVSTSIIPYKIFWKPYFWQKANILILADGPRLSTGRCVLGSSGPKGHKVPSLSELWNNSKNVVNLK